MMNVSNEENMLFWMVIFGACRTENKVMEPEETVTLDGDGDGFADGEDCDDADHCARA